MTGAGSADGSAWASAVVGTILDRRYRIDAVVGRGEKGAWVFRAHEIVSGAPVAVRCPGVPDDLAGVDYEQALDTFLAEAEVLARACAEGGDVEQVLAYGIAEPAALPRLPFCVFEWLEGKSLEQHIVERAGAVLSLSEALAILEPAARGLAAAHAMGVAHRDVRPRNLWLAQVGGRTRMKVTQFVLASRIGPPDDSFAPEYGAPEHFKRSYGAVGPATDVYGLALSLVELVSGKRALDGQDPVELYLAASDLARRPTLRGRGVQISDAVEAVLARALAVDPKRRWQSARELWDALVSAVPELTPAAPSVRPEPELGGGSDAGPSSARAGGASSVPSIWAARDQASAVVAPADDARLGDSAKLAAFAPPAPQPARRDRAGLAAWLVVALLAAAATIVIATRIGRPAAPAPPPARAATSRAPEPKASPPPSVKASAAPSALHPPGPDEPAVRFEPFLTDMVRVPAGSFTMGTDKEGRGDGPAHRVTITKAFYLDRTEVTAEAYAACVEEGSCTPSRVHADNIPETTWGCNSGKDQPRHPANCVDRAQAERFCAYAEKRLPTEAEWEYAARGDDAREYPWGNAPPTSCATAILLGLAGDCKDRKGTSEVGATAEGRSAFGALDMAGNVWEWVADGHEPYSPRAVTDPRAGLAAPYAKGVLRGGSWDYAPTSAKTTYRYPFQANIANISTGFRCARDAHD
ncbi:MAG: SUMF1/EgtB/PvdO family nonheme iron enzyme [Labilithrix sp.]|nr:SUMF1/EgtB/PvdO family nonheme iron enzyme [Labilithrix sp.]